MTHDQLIVAQAEAFTILRDLMHIKPDDPRPQRIINTIKQAALAILRLKPPLSRAAGEDSRGRQPAAGEGKSNPKGENHSTRQRGADEGERRPQTPTATQPPESTGPHAADPEPTAHLSDEQFTELVTHLPDLNPTTDKRRMRLARYLARYQLGVTPEIKAAIIARAERVAQSLQRELSTTARAA